MTAAKYHNIVGLLDIHLIQTNLDIMNNHSKTFLQDFQEQIFNPSQKREMIIYDKSEKVKNLKKPIDRFAISGCFNQLII